MTEKCVVCQEEFKNVYLHARTKHDISKEEYDEMRETTDEIDEQMQVQEKEKKETKKDELITTLDDFLEQYNMTEYELTNLVRNYKYNEPIPIKQIDERNRKLGQSGAETLKDKDTATTTDLHIAEALVKYYGFKVLEVTTKGGTIKKTWILKKIK